MSMDVGIRTRIGWTTDWRPLTPQAAEAPTCPTRMQRCSLSPINMLLRRLKTNASARSTTNWKPPSWIREGRTRYVFNPATVELAMGRLIAERLFKFSGAGR